MSDMKWNEPRLNQFSPVLIVHLGVWVCGLVLHEELAKKMWSCRMLHVLFNFQSSQ